MKFGVLMYTDPDETALLSAEERTAVFRKHESFGSETIASGELTGAAAFEYPAQARTLRPGGGEAGVIAADGPLTGEREQITGFYILECASLERAEQLASGLVDTHIVAVEVRRIHDAYRLG
jgi:hypothetical protein